MLLYCPNCQNLIEKTNDSKNEGETIVKKCSRCEKIISFYIKYKAYSSIIRADLTHNNK